MKPPPFIYHAPATVRETLDVLAEVRADGKVLAGGQSLIPLLNFRLAAPAHLVDINGVAGLDGIEVSADAVRVGATVRHADLEHHDEAIAAIPLLREALQLVAHPVIRNRGTVVGSIVHADPAAELPAVLALLGGVVEVASAQAPPRTIRAAEFFLGPLDCALGPGELATAVIFPRPASTAGTAFVEVARRHGDYALCGVAALLDRAEHRAMVACISVGPVPVVLDLSEAASGGDWAAAGAAAAAQVDPESDIHASAGYRRHLTKVLTERALRAASETTTA